MEEIFSQFPEFYVRPLHSKQNFVHMGHQPWDTPNMTTLGWEGPSKKGKSLDSKVTYGLTPYRKYPKMHKSVDRKQTFVAREWREGGQRSDWGFCGFLWGWWNVLKLNRSCDCAQHCAQHCKCKFHWMAQNRMVNFMFY